jgi:transmembrane sensor
MALETGDLTPQERAQFIDWLRESPRNVAEMLHISKLHRKLASFSQWDQISPASIESTVGQVIEFPVQPDRQRPFISSGLQPSTGRRLVVRVAASLLVALAVGVVAYREFGPERYQTQAGEQREVQLADGTVVDIAPNSRLRVRLRAGERDVDLLRGAALFRVAHNPQRPFIVRTSQGQAKAVGTSFSVDQRGPDMIVTVVEGRVAVSIQPAAPGAQTGRSATSGDTVADVTIGANQQVRVDRSGSLTPVVAIQGEREVSWAYGRLSFEDETVSEVVAKFNKYNRTQIRVVDPALADKRISGNFRASDIESFAQFVHTAAGVPVSFGENDEVIIGKVPTHP